MDERRKNMARDSERPPRMAARAGLDQAFDLWMGRHTPHGFSEAHCSSAGHRERQALFQSNPAALIAQYSHKFLTRFVALLSSRYGTKKVPATLVYAEYLKETRVKGEERVLLASTMWDDLEDFAEYLEQNRVARTEQVAASHGGPVIQWIDPETSEEPAQNRGRDHGGEEAKRQRLLERQIEETRKRVGPLKREIRPISPSVQQKITLPLKAQSSSMVQQTDIFDDTVLDSRSEAASLKKARHERLTNANDILVKGQRQHMHGDDGIAKSDIKTAAKSANDEQQVIPLRPDSPHFDSWLAENIVVRITNQDLADGAYYRQKAVVQQVIDEFGARVCVLDSNHILLVDQEDCETVVPVVGGEVLVLNGRYRGKGGLLLEIDVDQYRARITILGEPVSSVWLDYEDFSRYLGPAGSPSIL